MAKKQRQRQHHKGKHRPRAWHMGRRQGHVNDRLMKTTIEPAFAAAEADRAQVAETTKQHRRETKDHEQMMAQLDRAAPYVPSWDFDL